MEVGRATVMEAPGPETLLRIWEESAGSHPIRRALALLDAAWPDIEIGRWAQAPIGVRDGWLLRLYEALFGPQLQTVTGCPRCGETLESTFMTRDLRSEPPALPAGCGPLRLQVQGCDIEYRLPTSEDLLAIVEGTDRPANPPLQLLQRCVIDARRGGKARAPEDLPAEVLSRLGAEMAERDPGADIRIGLECPACSHAWSIGFDIISYLLGELEDWATRTLAEVHTLARAYGWSESAILGMSPTRRQYYIEMVHA
jgi:hypothetical protein